MMDPEKPKSPSLDEATKALTATGLLSPEDIQMLLGGGGAPAKQMTLEEALLGSAMDVTGRVGLTGQPFSGLLPPWARDLAPETLAHPDFDPYFGKVSDIGDERVYMGSMAPSKTKAKTEKDWRKSARELYGLPPASEHLMKDGSVKQVYDPSIVPEGYWKQEPTQWEKDSALAAAENGGEKPKTGSAALATAKVEWWYGPDWRERLKQTDPSMASRYANETDSTLTATQVLNLPYTWSEEKVAEAMKKMRASGINVTSFDQMREAWGGLVSRASMMYSMSEGKRKVTPWDVLDLYKSEAEAAGSFTNFENGRKVTTQKSVANITEGEAWASMQQTLSRMLGKDPSDQEVRDFAYRMNQLAAQNPAITKTITQFKAGDATSSSSSTEGGFSAADMQQAAYKKAQADPDYAEYQSATTYFNAALSAMGAIGGD